MSPSLSTCPKCGAPTTPSEKFCPACGAALLDLSVARDDEEPTGPDYDPVEEADRLDNPPPSPRRGRSPPSP